MADDAAAARLLCEAVEARVEVVPFAPLRGEQRGDLPGPGGRTPMTWRGVRTVMQLELRQRVSCETSMLIQAGYVVGRA